MFPPVVPEGQSPPFAVVTPTDHSAWIIIATALGFSCVLLFSFIRLGVRLTIAPPFGLDDVFLGAATVSLPSIRYMPWIFSDDIFFWSRLVTDQHAQVVSFAQTSTVLYAVSLGLGKSIELVKPERLVQVQKVSQYDAPSL